MSDKTLLETIWWAGVLRVGGYESVKAAIAATPNLHFSHVISVGKAASSMARAALDARGADLPALVVTKYEHGEKTLNNYSNLELIESAHPVPDENSLRAGKALIGFVDALPMNANLLMLASGGSSSLAEKLSDDSSLDDLKASNESMLASGLDIHAMNKKRIEISQIKNGKLLDRFKGRSLTSFIISDVKGDDVNVVGSGIGAVTSDENCRKAHVHVIASNAIARSECKRTAEQHGLLVMANEENLYGDVFDVAKKCSIKVKNGPSGVYIFGGEPVIRLPLNPGEGGRNQALATAMARELSGLANVTVLAAGTDGSDGPTDSAGGFATGQCWEKHDGGQAALDKANSGSWLREAGSIFVTGPTGTNVMDLMLVLKR